MLLACAAIFLGLDVTTTPSADRIIGGVANLHLHLHASQAPNSLHSDLGLDLGRRSNRPLSYS